MRVRNVLTTTMAATVLASLALTGCSGDDETTPKGAAECKPVKGAGSVTIRDDKGVLAAANIVSVTGTKGNYREPLEAVDRVTRAVSSADVAAVAAVTGTDEKAKKKRAEAVKAALADLNGKPGKPVVVHLAVPTDGDVVADLYRAGLAEGSKVTVVDSAEAALKAAEGRDVALVSLADLATQVKAKVGGKDLNDQLQATATAALKEKLALGATGELRAGTSVSLATNVAAQNVTTVGELAKVCGGVELAHTAEDAKAAEALAKEYGLKPVQVDDAASAIADGKAVAALS